MKPSQSVNHLSDRSHTPELGFANAGSLAGIGALSQARSSPTEILRLILGTKYHRALALLARCRVRIGCSRQRHHLFIERDLADDFRSSVALHIEIVSEMHFHTVLPIDKKTREGCLSAPVSRDFAVVARSDGVLLMIVASVSTLSSACDELVSLLLLLGESLSLCSVLFIHVRLMVRRCCWHGWSRRCSDWLVVNSWSCCSPTQWPSSKCCVNRSLDVHVLVAKARERSTWSHRDGAPRTADHRQKLLVAVVKDALLRLRKASDRSLWGLRW